MHSLRQSFEWCSCNTCPGSDTCGSPGNGTARDPNERSFKGRCTGTGGFIGTQKACGRGSGTESDPSCTYGPSCGTPDGTSCAHDCGPPDGSSCAYDRGTPDGSSHARACDTPGAARTCTCNCSSSRFSHIQKR